MSTWTAKYHGSSAMSERKPQTLLRPGAPEWAALNEEKRRLLTPPPDTPIEELLRRGERLSEQAARLAAAVERADEHRHAGA